MTVTRFIETSEHASVHGLSIWAWCLMTNHVHLLAVPGSRLGLARNLGRTHYDYACYRNTRSGKSGHVWQSRFYSCPVDTPAVWTVMAYIERNPVRAALVSHAEEYPWSSVTGRPFGSDTFTAALELVARRPLQPGRPGRPKKPVTVTTFLVGSRDDMQRVASGSCASDAEEQSRS